MPLFRLEKTFLSAANYFRSHKAARKAQLKEVHHSNDTSTVKVITPDGVTVLTSADPDKPPQLPPKRINKPPAPPPPVPPPSRPPAPPPPPSPPPAQVTQALRQQLSQQLGEDDEELKRIHEASTARLLQRASLCSSPDLPLPPPPPTPGEPLDLDEPLPPPPDFPDQGDRNSNNRTPVPLVYPKNSYMSYRNERKPIRQGFDGKYRRMSPTEDGELSPSTWEQIHNIRKQAPTVIFHSESMKMKSHPGHLPNGTNHNLQTNMDKSALDFNANSEQRTQEVHRKNRVNRPSSQTETIHGRAIEDSSPCRDPSSEVLCTSHQGDQSPMSCSSPDISPSSLSPVGTSSPSPSDVSSSREPVNTSPNTVTSKDAVCNEARGDEGVPEVRGCSPESDARNVPRINCATQTSDTPRLPRKQVEKTREELDCERLSKDFASYCQDVALKSLLVPVPEHKTMSDYMQGLFVVEPKNGQIRRRSAENKTSPSSPPANAPTITNGVHKEEANLPANSAYFTTSEPKAKLLNRFSQDFTRQEWTNDRELDQKKEELIASISCKLDLLRQEQVAIKEEVLSNDSLGREVAQRVEAMAKSNEVTKYRLHLDEMEKIINLLMGLSGRLARAQNALMLMPSEVDPAEKGLLEAKRDKLSAQHEEARHLKESIDRRSHQVANFLHRYLTDEEFADYEHFVKMKSKLLIDARELDEKIKLGEEQLSALVNGSGSVHLCGWYRTHTRTGSTSV